MKNLLFFSLIFCTSFISGAQNYSDTLLSFEEYMGYVKKYHPIVKQSNLVLKDGEAYLLKARGAFDPKFAFNQDVKNFKDISYYDKLDVAFKIPTWYGIELKGGWQQYSGEYLNPSDNIPGEGLYTYGVSVPVMKNLLIDKRRATLRKAKIYRNQTKEEAKVLVNAIMYKAMLAYFDWWKDYQKIQVFQSAYENSSIRFNNVIRSFQEGDIPAIDTIEAKIAMNNRLLGIEQAKLQWTKSSLVLSTFLWIESIPIQLKKDIKPDVGTISTLLNYIEFPGSTLDSFNYIEHPKLKILDYKYNRLKIEEKLRWNNLLPTIKVNYNLLSADMRNNVPENYKFGLGVNVPIFMRKERGELNLTRNKIQSIQFEKENTLWSIENKVKSVQQEVASFASQRIITNKMVKDYKTMLEGEERKFQMGESSLFLVNSRELKWIQSKLKAIETDFKYWNANGKLFNVLAL